LMKLELKGFDEDVYIDWAEENQAGVIKHPNLLLYLIPPSSAGAHLYPDFIKGSTSLVERANNCLAILPHY